MVNGTGEGGGGSAEIIVETSTEPTLWEVAATAIGHLIAYGIVFISILALTYWVSFVASKGWHKAKERGDFQ